MPGPSSLGVTPGFFNSYDRSLNQQDPYQYDPNNYVDPMAAVAMQQQYAKQLFAMQNPRMALPQQFGAALGGMLQQHLPQSMQAPQGAQGQPQGQGPKTPVAQAIEQAKVKYIQQGLPQGEALFKAAGDIEASGQFKDDPQADQILNHASVYAKEKLGYTPMSEKDRRELESNSVNLQTPRGTFAFIKGTPEYKQAIQAGAKVAGEVPQMSPGSLHEFKQGGLFVTMQVQADGSMKPVSKSSSPMQYQTSGNPEQMGDAGLIQNTSTAASNDKNKKEMVDRDIATTNAVAGIDKIVDTIGNNPSGVGTPGDVYEKGQNLISTVKNFAGYLGQEDLMDPKTYNWKGLDKTIGTMQGNAAAATKYHSQMVAAAYMMAAAQSNNNTDEKMTKARVEANLEMLAKHSDDPAIVINTLKSTSQMLQENMKRQAQGYGAETPVLDKYNADRQAKDKPPQRPGQGSSGPKAPQGAIDHLKTHPELKDAFKAKYGYLPDGV
jgi:hypothetical protein